MIGRTIGQYRITDDLALGSAARIFRAYDEALLRPVALKIAPIETVDRVSFMSRYERAKEVMRTLDHPNIMHVYDAGETDEFVYLALRLVEGGTLRQRIATQRMSTQVACRYMVQIAHALHHAHQQHILHGDVKPSKMLLGVEQPGHILLTGFGSMKLLRERTEREAIVSAPEYMSPEQAQGHEIDQRSDIYSLGCTLHEALAGRPPFVGATSVSLLYQQVYAQPTYIRCYNLEVPRELWKVLSACLAKQPEDRYDTAEQLAEELQPFADGLIQAPSALWASWVKYPLEDSPAPDASATQDTQPEQETPVKASSDAEPSALTSQHNQEAPLAADEPHEKQTRPTAPRSPHRSGSHAATRVFISHTAGERAAVVELVADLNEAGFRVWHDRHLMGGQPWWDEILFRILTTDIFMFVVSPESLNAAQCQYELDYATQLRKRIIPLRFTDGVDLRLLPSTVRKSHVVDYRQPDAQGWIDLAGALYSLPPSVPLPEPLPRPPDAPIAPLDTITEQTSR